MIIKDVILSSSLSGFYYDDQQAIKEGAVQDGFTYTGDPLTPGYEHIRQPGESISVMLILEDGQVAHGDCAAVQYSGVGGRDPMFSSEKYMPIIEKYVVPHLIDQKITSFREMAEKIDQIEVEHKKLHAAIRYGVTQAILDAVAKSQKMIMAEVIKKEYRLNTPFKKAPIYTQSGDDRYTQVDKMIIKQADVLPHGLINNVSDKLGEKGEKLVDYVKWISQRILKCRTTEDYEPTLHIDVYGTIGLAFNDDIPQIVDYLEKLEAAAKPFPLRIESPVDMGNREDQCHFLKTLRSELAKRTIKVELVADEWCNTLEDIKFFTDEKAVDMIQIKTPDLGSIHHIVEAILYCQAHGVKTFCGGTCNETDRSAQVTTHIAVACGVSQVLAKPGMGVDEGFMIVHNEMNRILALSQRTFG